MIFIITIYMITCSLFTLFKINIYDSYILVAKHSSSIAFIQNAMVGISLVNPICYNILQLFYAEGKHI